MPIELAHWRIAYPNGIAYHIIGATNIVGNANTLNIVNGGKCKRFVKSETGIKRLRFWQKYNAIAEPNGLASYFGDEPLGFSHVYVEGGRCIDAMNKMVELLDKEQWPLKHNVPICKF
jgi:hypothetical protein